MPAPKPAATTANCSRPVTGLYEPGARFDQLVRPQGVQCVPSENVVLCVALLMQAALEAEVTEFLGRDRYQRSATAPDARSGARNGYRPATVKTTAGPITLERS